MLSHSSATSPSSSSLLYPLTDPTSATLHTGSLETLRLIAAEDDACSRLGVADLCEVSSHSSRASCTEASTISCAGPGEVLRLFAGYGGGSMMTPAHLLKANSISTSTSSFVVSISEGFTIDLE